jgi:hypothetical protein
MLHGAQDKQDLKSGDKISTREVPGKGREEISLHYNTYNSMP